MSNISAAVSFTDSKSTHPRALNVSNIAVIICGGWHSFCEIVKFEVSHLCAFCKGPIRTSLLGNHQSEIAIPFTVHCNREREEALCPNRECSCSRCSLLWYLAL